jgi:hypothetical protein
MRVSEVRSTLKLRLVECWPAASRLRARNTRAQRLQAAESPPRASAGLVRVEKARAQHCRQAAVHGNEWAASDLAACTTPLGRQRSGVPLTFRLRRVALLFWAASRYQLLTSLELSLQRSRPLWHPQDCAVTAVSAHTGCAVWRQPVLVEVFAAGDVDCSQAAHARRLLQELYLAFRADQTSPTAFAGCIRSEVPAMAEDQGLSGEAGRHVYVAELPQATAFDTHLLPAGGSHRAASLATPQPPLCSPVPCPRQALHCRLV